MKAVCSVVIFTAGVALLAISAMALLSGAMDEGEFLLSFAFAGVAVGSTVSSVIGFWKE